MVIDCDHDEEEDVCDTVIHVDGVKCCWCWWRPWRQGMINDNKSGDRHDEDNKDQRQWQWWRLGNYCCTPNTYATCSPWMCLRFHIDFLLKSSPSNWLFVIGPSSEIYSIHPTSILKFHNHIRVKLQHQSWTNHYIQLLITSLWESTSTPPKHPALSHRSASNCVRSCKTSVAAMWPGGPTTGGFNLIET